MPMQCAEGRRYRDAASDTGGGAEGGAEPRSAGGADAAVIHDVLGVGAVHGLLLEDLRDELFRRAVARWRGFRRKARGNARLPAALYAGTGVQRYAWQVCGGMWYGTVSRPEYVTFFVKTSRILSFIPDW